MSWDEVSRDDTSSSRYYHRPRTTNAPAAVHFSVTDTGPSIPRAAFDRIFEKFGQVAMHHTTGQKSTGLGLTFCKMVVEAHGGRIWVDNELGN